MSITITGGISFSGGVGIVAPPPSEANAAWFTSIGTSNMQRITFATDTATASVRGKLSETRWQLGSVSTLDYGWWGAGFTNGSPNDSTSRVDRMTFVNDTAVNSVRGPLTTTLCNHAASSNGTTYGWFGGGNPGINQPRISTVTRIEYSNDTVVSTNRGPLSQPKRNLVASSNTTSGWWGGGYNYTDQTYIYSTVDRITYATDTATASVRGPLSIARYWLGGTGNANYGWFAGGATPGFVIISTVDRITYATDTATASVRGPMSIARYYLSGSGNTSYGWFGGGYPGPLSTVDRITYATDTATADVRGPLFTSGGNANNDSCGGVQ